MENQLKVISIRYFKTRRGLGYQCKTNVKGLEIWNDGQGGGTYLEGSSPIWVCKKEPTEFELEDLINEYEGVKSSY
jgi:hypothetical protein